ncbi:23S rRNA pseudouridine2605 synthase [Neorhizobium huautlense]|uniref:Pseudouridine synthase n=1 Tax=Neorhizobium huautlense TaxID=67774 RepID=A0ABT9PUS9_9HYPH|nr:pseudouridine synthase [Neorhizobium huautlense]MDP9838216.1 23S rRNA pseudouridine2605 synthase [Neorhizobium huautlense]
MKPTRQRPRPAARPASRPTSRPAAPTRTPAKKQDGQRVTLPRALSKLGYCSRTQAEDLIRNGHVSVGGKTITDTEAWIDLATAKISVDGQPVTAEKFVYLMLNKPRGLVTTRNDPQGRPTVYDCLTQYDNAHLSPVGRLDKASEGLLLFSNDTQFANALLDPKTHVAKTYHVQIDQLPDAATLEALRKGVTHDGEFLSARRVELLREGDKNAWLEIELDEGKNRQIRRMLESLDISTLRLVRVAIGDLMLGELEKGAVRALTDAELAGLKRQSGMGR